MKKVALLIGVQEYRDPDISPLKYVRSDVQALAGVLRETCDFDRVRVLADAEGDGAPELNNVMSALRQAALDLRDDDLFLFYFGGHGIEHDGSAYLMMPKTDHAFPDIGSLPIERLRGILAGLVARQRLLLFDACRNSPRAGRGDEDNPMGEIISRDIVAAARTVADDAGSTSLLAACRPRQRAYAWAEKQHGVFTYFLLEGLRGAAFDQGRLTFQDLAGYVQREVTGWSQRMPGLSRPQHPWYEHAGDPDPIVLVHGRPREMIPVAEIEPPPLPPSPPPLPPKAPPLPPPAPPGRALAERVADLLARHVPQDGLHAAPHIPNRKLVHARAACAMPDDQPVLALIDCTVFGSAKCCLIFGCHAIYFHNDWTGKSSGRGMIPYEQFPQCQFADGGFGEVALGNGRYLNVAGSDMPRAMIIRLLNQIAQWVGEASGGPAA